MQNIGERLADARKKRAVTLAEASKGTRIREEYLAALEKDDGRTIPLESVYVRGFFRNYSKFLRLDEARILADYDAAYANGNGGAPKTQKALIGRLDLGNVPTPEVSIAKEKEKAPEPAVEKPAIAPTEAHGAKISKRFSFAALPPWALGAALGVIGLLLAGGVIAGISVALRSRTEASASAASRDTKFVALGDVTVIIKQDAPEQTLFAGTLKKGEEKNLHHSGNLRVQYSEGSQLAFEKDGKLFKVGAAGAGKRVLE